MLEDLDLQLILNPDDADLLFRRGLALEALDRVDDAKGAYRSLLRQHPTHVGGMNNLARILHREGAHRPALVLLERLVEHDPRDAMGRANLGIVLLELDRFEAARAHLHAALELDPGLALAHLGLSRIYAIEGNDTESLRHQREALGDAALSTSAATPNAPHLLLLASEEQLGAVTAEWLADATFLMTTLVVERLEPDATLPPHHAVFNTITDADRNAPALERAHSIVARSLAPVINHPDAVLATARTALYERLRDLEDIIAPHVTAFSREEAGTLELGWPLLVRAPGFHSGQHFVMVREAESLPAALASLPGDTLLAIEMLGAQSGDGKFRKYRVMIVDGELYPLHVAVSDHWKVHYFSADMATHPERRAEDEAFLEDMHDAIGVRAVRALRAMTTRLGLDYGGIDFALDGDGRVLVFEANATMTVPAPPRGEIWDYRRPAVKRVLDATRRMLLRRARAGGWI